MLIAWSLALAVNVTDANGNAKKGMENELEKLLDALIHDVGKASYYFDRASDKVRRRHRDALILACIGLIASIVCSFFFTLCAYALLQVMPLILPLMPLILPLLQVMPLILLICAFTLELDADTNLISIFHDAALLILKRDYIVKALERPKECSDEQTSTPSRQLCSTSLNRLARLIMYLDPYTILSYTIAFSSYLDSITIIWLPYIIGFIGLFNTVFNLTTRVLGLSIQLQSLLSVFSTIVVISASILLGLSQWSVSTAVRGSPEPSCTSAWLEMVRGVRKRAFEIFMAILFLYALLFYFIPKSLTPSTGALDIVTGAFFFGLELGFLASLTLELMLLTSFREFIHLACSAGANTGK
jgi:hypothetical protein